VSTSSYHSDDGHAGRSARREAVRLNDRRIQRAAQRRRGWPRCLLAALLGPSKQERRELAEEQRWATGARGEELVAELLAKCCPSARVLHDRKMPRSRTNIDHLAVVPSGVYAIDTKRYRGRIQVRKPLFGAPSLLIAGRDRTKLVAGLHKQVDAVRAALAEIAPEAPVRGCFCFVAPEGRLADVGLPVLRTLEIDGFQLYRLRRLAKRLQRTGPLTAEQIEALTAHLAQNFPSA
jgi:hypothetical protein